ncbi:MarR family winged helix-turn-helix transcriptional regulator [Geodermatophilus chilensis]|jgi:MarR family transcriptional repressor of emrRAB|uniref:MarR family winged helix-turn-helix transcriptional regulator n=1 Tax=Geodermatophilus chilensis TaxID=2035835 RepID=UPI000C25B683|nr:MarR family transcriptional regulator [Geodermatophilus chilensis]
MDRVTNLLGTLALAVADRVAAATEAACGAGGAAAAVLVHLSRHPDTSVSDLAAVVGVGGSGGVRLADRLAALGVVTRAPSPTDRRTVLLRLTEMGTETARRVLDAREEAVRQVVEALGEDQRSALEQLLPDLVTALPSSRKEVLRTCRLCDVTACRQAPGCPLDRWPPDDGGPA